MKIIGPEGVVRWDAIVDSGSDITLLPGVIANDLGIDLGTFENSTVCGVGNQPVVVRESGVELELTDGIEFYHWDAEVSFLVTDGAESHFALLGHRGCLDFFAATFDGDARTLEIIPGRVFPGVVGKIR